MKKIIIAIAVIAFSTAGAQAQTSFGLKGGMTVSTFGSTVDYPGVTVSSKIGYYAGAFADIGVSENFAIQPELLYALLGAKTKVVTPAGVMNDQQDLGYLLIPVLAKYKSNGFFVVAGPQVGILLSAKNSAKQSFKKDIKNTDFAGVIGVGYTTMGGFGFDTRYQLGFGGTIKEGQDGKVKNNAFYFGVHYQFGK